MLDYKERLLFPSCTGALDVFTLPLCPSWRIGQHLLTGSSLLLNAEENALKQTFCIFSPLAMKEKLWDNVAAAVSRAGVRANNLREMRNLFSWSS